ncbi:MAG: ring-opening amidohydrolase [Alphaproteobacteria bacterium]
MRAHVDRHELADPGDASGLAAAIAAGTVDARDIVAVIGKTHGNGLVNDYTRAHLTLVLSGAIARATGETRETVAARVPFIFSGGCEGVLSPHYVVLSVDRTAPPGVPGRPALAIGTALSTAMAVADIGREAQVAATAAAVREAMAAARIERPQDVHFVQVKGPARTGEAIAASAAAGRPAVAGDANRLMAWGRVACAFGVARALGEATADETAEAAMFRDYAVRSDVASISAGVEVDCNEVVVIGMSAAWSGPLAIAHRPMADALDIGAVYAVLRDVGLDASPQVAPAERDRLRAVFVKCEPQRDGRVRGRRHTMLDDGDINAQRHIRGAVGALVAGVLGETAIFVSGGAEHQGPDGGGLVAVIAERADGLTPP